jgi:hypothetical protein
VTPRILATDMDLLSCRMRQVLSVPDKDDINAPAGKSDTTHHGPLHGFCTNALPGRTPNADPN